MLISTVLHVAVADAAVTEVKLEGVAVVDVAAGDVVTPMAPSPSPLMSMSMMRALSLLSQFHRQSLQTILDKCSICFIPARYRFLLCVGID